MRFGMVVLLPACLVVLASPALGGELAGVTLPDSVVVEGTTLLLNGLGLREATMLKVDVYVAGLYLEAKTGDAEAILGAPALRRLVMHFVRDVGRADLAKGFGEGFDRNAGEARQALGERIDRLNGWLTDVKVGDTIVFTFLPGQGVRVDIRGQERGAIPGDDFARGLLSVWLGPKPPNAGLKNGILGK